jgi:hypothetical protein
MCKRSPLTMRSIYNRLTVATHKVQCAYLASGNIKAKEDAPCVETVLDYALCDIQELLGEMQDQLPAEDETEGNANG